MGFPFLLGNTEEETRVLIYFLELSTKLFTLTQIHYYMFKKLHGLKPDKCNYLKS